MTKERLRFKWGIGRIVYEAPVLPIIVPIWHEGMDTVLPNVPPYILRFGKKVTINVGQPIDLQQLVDRLRSTSATEEEARKAITDAIQTEMLVSFNLFLGKSKNFFNFFKILSFLVLYYELSV